MSFILLNTKVSALKDHGEKYIKVRPPLVRDMLSDEAILSHFRGVHVNEGPAAAQYIMKSVDIL